MCSGCHDARWFNMRASAPPTSAIRHTAFLVPLLCAEKPRDVFQNVVLHVLREMD